MIIIIIYKKYKNKILILIIKYILTKNKYLMIILWYIIIILQVLLNLYKCNYNSKSSSLISIISNGIPQGLPFSIPHVHNYWYLYYFYILYI